MVATTRNDLVFNKELFDYGYMQEYKRHEAAMARFRVAVDFQNVDYKPAVVRDIRYFNKFGSIRQRDPNDLSPSTVTNVTQGVTNRVPHFIKFGPIGITLGELHNLGYTGQRWNVMMGQVLAREEMRYAVDLAVGAICAALISANLTVTDEVAAGKVDQKMLQKSRRALGDQFQAPIMWSGHSYSMLGLIEEGQSAAQDQIAALAIEEGSVKTLGLPFHYFDSPSFVVSGTPDVYRLLGLTANAAHFAYTRLSPPVVQMVDAENTYVSFSREADIEIGVREFEFNTATGGEEPDQSALWSSANWTSKALEAKSLPGTMLLHA